MTSKFERDVAAAKAEAGLPEDASMQDLHRHTEQMVNDHIGRVPEDPHRIRFRFIPVAAHGEPGTIEARKALESHDTAIAAVSENGWQRLIERHRSALAREIGAQAMSAGWVDVVRDGNEVVATLTVTRPTD